MTMQVGMVGTDGVLIASDTKWHSAPQIPTEKLWVTGRHSFNSPKIKISEKRGIAVSRALNMETASHVADEIIENLDEHDFPNPVGPIEVIGERVLHTADRQDAHCLIVLARPVPQLFMFCFGLVDGTRGPICRKMESISFAGDNVNPAMFWAERYYKKLPIKTLIPLAAHLIFTARNLNNGAIGGLEIVLCDESGFHRLSDESLNRLESWSYEFDQRIESLLLDRLEFSYAPNVV